MKIDDTVNYFTDGIEIFMDGKALAKTDYEKFCKRGKNVTKINLLGEALRHIHQLIDEDEQQFEIEVFRNGKVVLEEIINISDINSFFIEHFVSFDIAYNPRYRKKKIKSVRKKETNNSLKNYPWRSQL